MKVLATSGLVREVVESVAGAHVQVTELMRPGTDPHLYTPVGRDHTALLDAEMTFCIGLMLESGVWKAEEEDGSERIRLLPVILGIGDADLLRCPRTGAVDPHVWLDVLLWVQAPYRVAWHLAHTRPPFADPRYHEEFYLNADRCRSRLAALEAYVRQQVARVPRDRRVLVTAHHAFGYFGRAYGFEVRALQGAGTSLLASTDDEVEALADFVVARRVPVMFTESTVGSGGLERVQRAVRARGREVRIAGPLYSDALARPGTPQGTYEGMMRHNVDTIVNALRRDPLARLRSVLRFGR